jgi:hypothetical protein
MAQWIENDIRRPKARGQMVIAQNQVRGTKLIVTQVRDFNQCVPINELATLAGSAKVCEDDHDIEI